MDADTLYSIGDLARRTGLTVKTIRFYSDEGIVPPADRSPAGYRRYGPDAAARLDLVRTLRDLGLDLATIRKVVNREVPLARVAAAHVEALRAQIRTLRRRQAVLTAVARRGSTPEEMELMNELAGLSEDERHRLITDFLDATFPTDGPPPGASGSTAPQADGYAGIKGSAPPHPADDVAEVKGATPPHPVGDFAGARSSMTPYLPEDPEPEQVEAWVELAELSRDPEFRAVMRRMAVLHAAERAGGGLPRPDAAAIVRDVVRPALEAGVDPSAPEAAAVVAQVRSRYGGADLRAALEAACDVRRDRYMELLAIVNGWPPPEPLTPALTWFAEALRAQAASR
ncbi:MerR family transcriptional regulator [Nonomuraea aridisoli]|uniref:MerR family transcriptional regulator n=1 Tax=Nonomuraea aridisoli TaxID=2070368 RepID=A0A2W2FAC0_9ACTN|nr:MerR family transcriptional regulator [Nonomuraea aridisoli]PZG18537.1 MerR family transcriptional regulator [Nonomuraea aridisoli]